MRIHVPAGTPALRSDLLDSDEVLLGRGQRFRVIADHGMQGSTRRIDVEIVPALDDIGKSARANAGKRYNPLEPRDPHSGEWIGDGSALVSDVAKMIERPTRGRVATDPRVLGAAELPDWGHRHYGGPGALTAEQHAAINWYSHRGDRAINGVLRHNFEADEDESAAEADARRARAVAAAPVLDSAFRPLPEDVTLWRSVDLGAFAGFGFNKGDVFSDPGYLSTTASRAHLYDGDVRMTIRAPKGTPSYYMDGASDFPAEHEVLLGRGLRLRVADAKPASEPWRAGGWDVTFEVVLDEQ
jgi:hypothetical protein